ncbi:MAG TPA: nucleotidyltransferase domain-containing protein, partial [Leptospiraceae bacterium]|nr:nucleotidyltransferase domain-containing protein [Leptospiraceae bacterium]
MNLLAYVRSQRKELIAIAKKHGAYDLRVFGSVARGEESDKSDIDILVSFEKGRSLFDEVRLFDELTNHLNHKSDLVGE